MLAKGKALALTVILALSFLIIIGTQLVKEGKANPYPMPGVKITLRNPQNMTYDNSTVPVFVTATVVHLSSRISFSYKLDNAGFEPIPITPVSAAMVPYNPPFSLRTLSGNFHLFNLSEGWHKITVYCQTWQDKIYSDEDAVDFFVDTVPTVSFLSFENRTFETSDVPLNFTVNQAYSKINYSLDGQDNLTIIVNTTLTELPNGEHNVTIYVTDDTGNTGASEPIIFSVNVPETPEPFSTTLMATASGASVAIIGAGLLVYFKKRKR